MSRGELAIRLVRVERDRMAQDAMSHVDELDEDGDGLLSWDEVKLVCTCGQAAGCVDNNSE